MSIEKKVLGAVALTIAGVAIGAGAMVTNNHYVTPLKKSGNYVYPQEIRMEVEDVNKDGTYESFLEYKGQRRLMKYDSEKNTVSLIPYSLKIQESR